MLKITRAELSSIRKNVPTTLNQWGEVDKKAYVQARVQYQIRVDVKLDTPFTIWAVLLTDGGKKLGATSSERMSLTSPKKNKITRAVTCHANELPTTPLLLYLNMKLEGGTRTYSDRCSVGSASSLEAFFEDEEE